MTAVLSCLLQNWKLVLFGVLAAALYVQTQRLDNAHEELDRIEAAAEAQREQVRLMNKASDHITRKANDAQKKRDAARDRAIADLRRSLRDARASVVPSIPDAARGGDGMDRENGAICFAGSRLREGVDAAVGNAAARAAELVQLGALALDRLETCAAWAVEQHRLHAK